MYIKKLASDLLEGFDKDEALSHRYDKGDWLPNFVGYGLEDLLPREDCVIYYGDVIREILKMLAERQDYTTIDSAILYMIDDLSLEEPTELDSRIAHAILDAYTECRLSPFMSQYTNDAVKDLASQMRLSA